MTNQDILIEKYQLILNTIPDLIFLVDSKGKFIEYFPSSKLSPFAIPDQILGKTIKEIFPEPYVSQILMNINKTLVTNNKQKIEFQLTYENKVLDFETDFIFRIVIQFLL